MPRSSENGRKELLELHVIVNSEDQGPVASIPYTKEPLYVVIDVYGCTKQVRIVQKPYGGTYLKRKKVFHVIHLHFFFCFNFQLNLYSLLAEKQF